MKKLFVLVCAALALSACTCEDSPMLDGEDSPKQEAKLVQVSEITRTMGDGAITIAPELEDLPDCPCRAPINITFGLGFNYDYVVIADDFAIQNGDKLYMDASIPGYDHKGVFDGYGNGEYISIDDNGYELKGHPKLHLTVKDIEQLYASYVGKVDEEGNPFISESGVLTLVVYLWPGELDDNGKFYPIYIGEGYIMGDENAPVEHAINNTIYSVKVSIYKGRQGLGLKDDGSFDQEGWSYVKASIHISPKHGIERFNAE